MASRQERQDELTARVELYPEAQRIVRATSRGPICVMCRMPLMNAVEEWVGLCSRCEDEHDRERERENRDAEEWYRGKYRSWE